MKLSLKVKLTISYILISLLLIGSLLFTMRSLFNTQFENYVKDNQGKSSTEIANQVIGAFGNDGTPPNGIILKNIGETALAKGFILRVDNNNGDLIWCMDQEQCNTMLMDMEHKMNSFYSDFSGKYLENGYEILKNGVSYGTVNVGYYGPFYYNTSDLQFLKMINRVFIFTALFALVIAILLGFFMANRISGPIKKVIEHTDRIQKGNYLDRIEVTSNTNEVDGLLHSVNSLAETLNRQFLLRKRLAQDYSHEFRTPLASLKSNLEAMIDGIWEPTKERLQSCNEEISRLTRMVSGIDQLVEIENNNTMLNKTLFSPLDFVNKIIINFEKEISEKNIVLTVEGSTCTVDADKDKIGQVIINLISNAIKYTDHNGKIDICIIDKTCEVEISVHDNGMGIEEEDLPYIFEHLYRTDKSRARDTGGSGIGLAVAKAIVESHGGKLTVESELSKMSKFTVILPK